MYSDNAMIRALHRTKQDLLGTLWFQLIGLIVPPTAGAIAALVIPGNVSPQTQIALGTIAAFATLTLVVVVKFLWNLHSSPYDQRDEARAQVHVLENKMQPVLELVNEKEEAGKFPGDRGWGLVIRNRGVDKAVSCSARIEAIEFELTGTGQTLERWPIDRPLQWAGQEGEDYDIPGGQAAHLDIAYIGAFGSWGPEVNRRATLAYRGDEAFRVTHALPESVGPILLLINLVSEGQLPLYILCKLDVQVMKGMITGGLTERQPFKCLYFGSDRPTLSDFQSEHPASGVFR